MCLLEKVQKRKDHISQRTPASGVCWAESHVVWKEAQSPPAEGGMGEGGENIQSVLESSSFLFHKANPKIIISLEKLTHSPHIPCTGCAPKGVMRQNSGPAQAVHHLHGVLRYYKTDKWTKLKCVPGLFMQLSENTSGKIANQRVPKENG